MAASKRKRIGLAGWRALLAQQAASGLSVSGFCAQQGLSTARFYQWRARLREGMDVAASAATGERSTDTFVDLGSVAMGAGRLELRLDLGGGVVLHLSRG